jgi:hypothetical protein
MTRFFQGHASSQPDAASQAIGWVGQTLQQQIDLLSYIDVFRSLAIIGALGRSICAPPPKVTRRTALPCREPSIEGCPCRKPNPAGD